MPLTTADERRRDVLSIDGMFCAACAASVEAALCKYPGVASASVNFAADAAVLEWKDENADAAGALSAVRRLGYRARLVGDDDPGDASADGSRQHYLGLRLIVAAFFGMWAMLPSIALYLNAIADADTRYALACAAGLLSLPVVAFSGLPFYRMGIATLRQGIAGVDALITLGVAGSFILSLLSLSQGSAEVYFEVPVALITLQLVARLLDLRVRGRARDAVIGLLELAPSTVTVVEADGTERQVSVKSVGVGDCIKLVAGDAVAVDGRVVAGNAEIDRSLLTGESRPVQIGIGDSLNAGEHVMDGALRLKITAAVGKRRLDGLAKQVRQMLAERPAWQKVADLIARYFLWLSAIAAAIGAGVALSGGATWAEAAVRALAVFVIACPCALSLAAPVVGLTASAAAARRGIVLRDLNAITAGAVPDRVFLDKTGTLTVGSPQVVSVHAFCDGGPTAVLRAAAAAEKFVDHPVARAIVHAATKSGTGTTSQRAPSYPEVAVKTGAGVFVRNDSETIRVGQIGWLQSEGVAIPALPARPVTRAGVAVNGRFVGAIDLEDALRPGADQLINELKSLGIEPIVLSGDTAATVDAIAARLRIEGHSALSPEAKVEVIEATRAKGLRTAFAGDGLNDGPALAAAHLGIAVSGATDAARSAAAVTLVDADVTDLPRVFRLTRRAREVLWQNLVFAVAYNLVAIPAAIAGWVHPAIAAVAMALSSLTVVLNAVRAGWDDERLVPARVGAGNPVASGIRQPAGTVSTGNFSD